MTRAAVIMICLALASCAAASPEEATGIAPGASVTLGVDQSASIQGTSVSLRFLGVIEDSRCPRDTTCVWAGEVKVKIEILERSKESRQVELKIGESATAGGRVVTLEQVEPQPMSTIRIAANGYRATLKIG